MKEESDTANEVTQSDRLTAEASATASLLRHVMQIGPARPTVLAEAGGGQNKDMQAADRNYLLQANNSSNGWREHASMSSVVVVIL